MATTILKQQLYNELKTYFFNNSNYDNLKDYINFLINKYSTNSQINNLNNISNYLNNNNNNIINVINDIYGFCVNFDVKIIENLLLFFNPKYISIYEIQIKLDYIDNINH